MSDTNFKSPNTYIPPIRGELNPDFYNLSGQELDFFKRTTKITDDDALKQHVLDIQNKAYHNVHAYPCIKQFSFLRFKSGTNPEYAQVVARVKEDPSLIFADLGCCFGTDVRKAVDDGFSADRTLGTDLRQDFIDLGYQLFSDSPETCGIKFLSGDIFDEKFLDPKTPPPAVKPTSLKSITTLSEVTGSCDAIHAGSFFHLFDEETQFRLAKIVASLASTKPGTVIFGIHRGEHEKGLIRNDPSHPVWHMFCHDPDSWKAVWDGGVFQKGTWDVKAEIEESPRPGWQTHKANVLVWSLTKL